MADSPNLSTPQKEKTVAGASQQPTPPSTRAHDRPLAIRIIGKYANEDRSPNRSMFISPLDLQGRRRSKEALSGTPLKSSSLAEESGAVKTSTQNTSASKEPNVITDYLDSSPSAEIRYKRCKNLIHSLYGSNAEFHSAKNPFYDEEEDGHYDDWLRTSMYEGEWKCDDDDYDYKQDPMWDQTVWKPKIGDDGIDDSNDLKMIRHFKNENEGIRKAVRAAKVKLSEEKDACYARGEKWHGGILTFPSRPAPREEESSSDDGEITRSPCYGRKAVARTPQPKQQPKRPFRFEHSQSAIKFEVKLNETEKRELQGLEHIMYPPLMEYIERKKLAWHEDNKIEGHADYMEVDDNGNYVDPTYTDDLISTLERQKSAWYRHQYLPILKNEQPPVFTESNGAAASFRDVGQAGPSLSSFQPTVVEHGAGNLEDYLPGPPTVSSLSTVQMITPVNHEPQNIIYRGEAEEDEDQEMQDVAADSNATLPAISPAVNQEAQQYRAPAEQINDHEKIQEEHFQGHQDSAALTSATMSLIAPSAEDEFQSYIHGQASHHYHEHNVEGEVPNTSTTMPEFDLLDPPFLPIGAKPQAFANESQNFGNEFQRFDEGLRSFDNAPRPSDHEPQLSHHHEVVQEDEDHEMEDVGQDTAVAEDDAKIDALLASIEPTQPEEPKLDEAPKTAVSKLTIPLGTTSGRDSQSSSPAVPQKRRGSASQRGRSKKNRKRFQRVQGYVPDHVFDDDDYEPAGTQKAKPAPAPPQTPVKQTFATRTGAGSTTPRGRLRVGTPATPKKKQQPQRRAPAPRKRRYTDDEWDADDDADYRDPGQKEDSDDDYEDDDDDGGRFEVVANQKGGKRAWKVQTRSSNKTLLPGLDGVDERGVDEGPAKERNMDERKSSNKKKEKHWSPAGRPLVKGFYFP
ncbi:hypothetical protein F4780DRAFT_198115 [Xylariomycetidae sp. FL0641]|nr:hypothetical protein F4780DRAFT_198115 [Xylariomycetidae sp. FL0641]